MKKVMRGVVAAILFAGCSTYLSVDPRVTIAEDLGRDILLTQSLITSQTSDGRVTYQANVQNMTGDDLGIEWQMTWSDASGVTVETLASTWNKVMIPAGDVTGLKGTAPRVDVKNVRIYVRRLRN